MGEGIRRPLSRSIACRAAPSFLVAILLPWSVHAQPPGTWTATGSVGHARQGDGPGLSSDSGAFTAGGSEALGADSSQGSVVPAENLTSSSSEPSLLQVTYDRPTDQISIHARNTTLEEVLLEITRKTELSIESRRREIFREQVSVELDNLPLEQALRKLLREFNSAFLYSSPIDEENRAAATRLIKVILLGEKASGQLEVQAAKEKPKTESKSGTDSYPAVGQGAKLVRALLEKNSLLAKGIVEALKEPGREREREEAAEDLVGALFDRLVEKDVTPYSDFLSALKALAPEKTVDVLSEWLQGEDPQIRHLAAVGFGVLKDEMAAEPLIWALRDPDQAMQHAAITNLVWIGGSRVSDALFQAYFAGDNEVKHLIERAIVSHGDAGSREVLANVVAAGLRPTGPPLRDEWPEKKGVGTNGEENAGTH